MPIRRIMILITHINFFRWMKLRKIDLTTADGLPPLPMQISWVRDGILVVGMDSEMHVYSQWKPNTCKQIGELCINNILKYLKYGLIVNHI